MLVTRGCRLSIPTSGIRALVREGFWLLGRPIEGFFGVRFSGRSRRLYPVWATRLSTTKVAAGSIDSQGFSFGFVGFLIDKGFLLIFLLDLVFFFVGV